MSEPRRVGILISGRGSNMVALVDSMLAGKVPAEPAVVLSNVGGAAGLELARKRGVPTAVVEHRKITPRDQHERKVVETLREHGVESR